MAICHESLEKLVPMFSKTLSLYITRPYNLLDICKGLLTLKDKVTFKTKQLTLIYTEVKIY